MPSSRSPARQYYDQALRLLAAVEDTPENGPLLAFVHATLATVDPRKLRQA